VRVAAVLKETRMSKPRTFLSFTTVCSAALLAARLAVWMFPLQAPAQGLQTSSPNFRTVITDGPGVTVEPGAKILHRSSIFFAPGTPNGTVVVESTVNAKGEVTDARVISGPDELRRSALSSVLGWHFSAEGGLPPTVQTTIRFEATPQAAQAAAARAARTNVITAPSHAPNWNLKSIEMLGLSDDLAEQVRTSLPVHVGDPLGSEDLERVSAAVAKIDEHLTVQMHGTPPDATLTVGLWSPNARETVVTSRAVSELVATAGATSGAAMTTPASAMPQRIRVGGQVQASNLIKKVVPLYPPLAKQAGISGTVRFTVVIGKDGSVLSLQLVDGHPLLAQSAQDAVQQWQYRPTLLNGSPVEIITQVDVNFTLTQ
jgi:TonB family protein